MSRNRSGLGCSPALLGILVLVVLLGTGGYLVNQYSLPVPGVEARPRLEAKRDIGSPPPLPWPVKGSAAVSVKDFGLLGAEGDQAPRPIASTAKIMTAILMLEDRPLETGQSGPEVTITQQDVADYLRDAGQDQSVVPVKAGDKLTEQQLLQALLLPSGNNIADIIAKWDAGTRDAFILKMNSKANALGMTKTHYDDASGFSPKTVSTPSDLLVLGAHAMTNPVFRQTVAMAQTTLPVAGVVKNVNTILGKDGNIGIKTGTTDEAGGCFVSASTQQVAGRPMEVYAAVLGQDHRDDALDSTMALSRAVASNFQQAKLLSRGDVMATLVPAWGDPVDVVPSQDVETLVWPGSTLNSTLRLSPIQAPLPAGAKVGTVTLEIGKQSQQIDVVTTGPIPEPTWQWRVTRFLRHQ